jgi:hypothetical protein
MSAYRIAMLFVAWASVAGAQQPSTADAPAGTTQQRAAEQARDIRESKGRANVTTDKKELAKDVNKSSARSLSATSLGNVVGDFPYVGRDRQWSSPAKQSTMPGK